MCVCVEGKAVAGGYLLPGLWESAKQGTVQENARMLPVVIITS